MGHDQGWVESECLLPSSILAGSAAELIADRQQQDSSELATVEG